MSLTTTSRQIGSSSIPFTDHENHTMSPSDHWQVSQYFPIDPLGAHRWSRASDGSEKPAAAVSESRALDAIDGAGEKPQESVGRPAAASATDACVRRSARQDRVHATTRQLGGRNIFGATSSAVPR
jgi:hypothetical protein